MSSQYKECGDIEAGECAIPEAQQAFICKVYLIISIQLLFTFLVVFHFLIFMFPFAYFILTTTSGFMFLLILCVITVTAFCLLSFYNFANFFLLGVFTTALALLVGLTCASATGKEIMESMTVTTAVIVNLTVYSFWGASGGLGFDFLGPLLFASAILIKLLISVLIIFPRDKMVVRMYGFLGSITFCGHIVYVTDTLIIRSHSYKKYVRAAVCLFIEFINLFLLFFTVFKALDE